MISLFIPLGTVKYVTGYGITNLLGGGGYYYEEIEETTAYGFYSFFTYISIYLLGFVIIVMAWYESKFRKDFTAIRDNLEPYI